MNIVNVPEHLRPLIKDERLMLEEYFYNYFVSNNIETERYYLPIMWITLYHRGANDLKKAIDDIQLFLDTLDRSKKYFTITIYDDGILNDLSKLDIKVFAGESIHAVTGKYFPIPLTYLFRPNKDFNRVYKVCYLGHETHPIRKKIVELYKHRPNWFIFEGFISYYRHDSLMNSSVFALCPRGYGVTSYRISEALHFGAIPIYISDHFINPFNIPFESYGIRVRLYEVDLIHKIIRDISPEEICKLRKRGEEVFNSHFKIDSCCKRIIENIDG